MILIFLPQVLLFGNTCPREHWRRVNMQERHQNIQKVRYSSQIDNQKPRISAALWPDMWQACWDTQWHTLQSNLTRKEQEGVRELCAVHPSLGPAIVFLQECNACHNDFKAPWSKKKNVQSGTKPACLRITSPGCGVQFLPICMPDFFGRKSCIGL